MGRPTGMAPGLTEALMGLPVFVRTISGQAETLSAGGCKVVYLWMPSREAAVMTAAWTLDPMVGMRFPFSLHSLRAERIVLVCGSGTRPDKHTPLEALLTAGARVRTQAFVVGVTPEHRDSAEGQMEETHQEVVKASDPQEASARRGRSCMEA